MTQKNLKKPAVSANNLKGKIIEWQGKLYESRKRPSSDTYVWRRLSTSRDIDEDEDMMMNTTNYTKHVLESILQEINVNPKYKLTWIDYASFHEHRAEFPTLWNQFQSSIKDKNLRFPEMFA